MSILDTLPEPGLLAMSAAEYHADPCGTPSLSSSVAKILCNSTPAHARLAHPKLNPTFEPVDEARFDLGTVAHGLLLEGETSVEVIDADSWRTKAAQEARDEARTLGRTPLLEKDWERVQAMAHAARRQLEMVDCDPAPLTGGKPEQTLIWHEDGVECRIRIDWLHDSFAAIDDLKTTAASADPASWVRTMYAIGGDIQAAFYLRGMQKALDARPEWRFIVQENYAPYALSVVTLSPAVLELADRKVDFAIETWRRCLETGNWPGYTRQVASVDLPAWEERQWDSRQDAAVAAVEAAS